MVLIRLFIGLTCFLVGMIADFSDHKKMMFAIIFSDIRNFNELRGKLHKTCRFK